VVASRPFWLLRTVTGLGIIAGQCAFIWNILMTAVYKGPLPVESPPPRTEPIGGRIATA
jgi:cbb3-type cytochrome oxidase subunit 1